MSSGKDSPEQAMLLSNATPTIQPEFQIDIPGRLPSWNDILGMEQWARYKFKKELSEKFLSELRATAAACSTKTTSAKNIMSIFADTLESYLRMRQEQRKLKCAKKRLEAKSPNLFESKSSASKLPF